MNPSKCISGYPHFVYNFDNNNYKPIKICKFIVDFEFNETVEQQNWMCVSGAEKTYQIQIIIINVGGFSFFLFGSKNMFLWKKNLITQSM